MAEVLKTNGERLTGVKILMADAISICPIIYIEPIYDDYVNGASLDSCVEKIVDMRREHGTNLHGSEILNLLTDWDFVKKNVFPVIISKSENTELLQSIPSKEYLDLAVIYVIKGINIGEGNGSVKITHELLTRLNVSLETVHEYALKNLEDDGYQLRDMEEIVRSMILSEKPTACEAKNLDIIAGKMYVLSNKENSFGAAGVLNQRFLKEHLGDISCYIIPSSVHELILIPLANGINAEDLTSMIREVNETQVQVSERLSNHPYFYDGTTHEVSFCK